MMLTTTAIKFEPATTIVTNCVPARAIGQSRRKEASLFKDRRALRNSVDFQKRWRYLPASKSVVAENKVCVCITAELHRANTERQTR